MLKMTGVESEKSSEIKICLQISKGLRRRICYIFKRYIEANNKYMKNYDPAKPQKFVLYLDMNNLYDWGMSGYPP